MDVDRYLLDISEIGKGRFAQRLVSYLNEDKIPDYLNEAILYVAGHVS